jgi:tetratricopeptide (TPR) repeat protein
MNPKRRDDAMYADNRHYREYQRMLVKLHSLIAQGTGDSAEAIELRQAMEEPEQHLSQEQMVRLNSLSGDLSMMHDREIPDLCVVSRLPPDEIPARLYAAYQRRDWEEVLALLRADVSGFLRPDQVAYMRSRAYEALEELAPAVAFIDEADRRAPGSPNYRALAMQLLWKDARYDEAYDRARSYLTDSATPSRLLLAAAGIVSQRGQQDHVPVDIVPMANRAIERLEGALSSESSPAVLFAAHVASGLLAALVKDGTKAESALTQAIDIQAGTEGQVIARGLLMAERGLIRGGHIQSTEARNLARQLAHFALPDYYAVPA